MALTDNNEQHPVQPNEQARAASAPASLTRLSELHFESTRTIRLTRFLNSAVHAGAALLLLGGAALIADGGAPLNHKFVWCVLVLIAVMALLYCHIRAVAQVFGRAPMHQAARTLRRVLTYAGIAWGAGAFLVLGGDPIPLLGICFAALPSLAIAWLVADRAASLGFIIPVTAITIAAAIARPWSDFIAVPVLLLVVQGVILTAFLLPRRAHRSLPAGLSLQ